MTSGIYKTKKWYKSKTMWANIAVGLATLAGVVIEALPILESQITVEAYKGLLFVATFANIDLRKITTTGVRG